MLQRRDTSLGYPQHHNEEINSAASPSAPFGPLLQPENMTAAHKSFPPIPPLPQFASTVDHQSLLPPYTSMGPRISSLPALNPTQQSMTIQAILNRSDKEVRQSPQTSTQFSSDEDIRPSGNLSRAQVSRQSKKSPRSGTHARRSSTSHTSKDGSRRPYRRSTRSPSSSPEIAQETRALRYSTEEQHFIWYLRIDRGYAWPDLLDAFNARFSGNGGRRGMSGLQCRYYRLLGEYGIPQVRMLRTADVVQRWGMKASLARAGRRVTYPWLSGQYPNNAYGQVLDGEWNGQQLAKLAETYQRRAPGFWEEIAQGVGKPSNVCEAKFVASRANPIASACLQCHRTFTRPADLKRHIDSHAQGGFLCPAREGCRVFTRRDHLRIHLETVHSWVLPKKALKNLGPEDAEQVHAEEQVHEGGQILFERKPNLHTAGAASNKRPRPKEERPIDPPAKRSRWSSAEDAKFIRLHESGKEREDVSNNLPGRTTFSCRSHDCKNLNTKQDEDKQSRLEMLYTRLKPDLWKPIASQLGIPWQVCEAMHWAIGEKSQRNPFPEASNTILSHQRASRSTKADHQHFCFRCERPRAIDTCDGWKRHMKEHETVFPCRQCEDSDTAGKPRSFSRKANLEKHLIDTHNMSIPDASAQADTCRKTRKRKYFSCGFCVSLFGNIANQLNHIDTEHFRRHEDISGWNISKVIKGLIQQPGVSLFFQHFFGAGSLRSQDFAWNDSVAEDLQLRLELGEQSAADLAWAAISQVIWTEIPPVSDQASVPGGFTNPHMEMDRNMLSVQDRAPVTPICFPSADGCPPGNLAFTPVNTATPPALVECSPDKTEEAKRTFQVISSCFYTSENIGSSQDGSMVCNCFMKLDGHPNVNTACGEDDCINRATKMECVDNCGCGDDCQNRRFQRQEFADVEVFETNKKGYGLRAKTNLSPDEFIHEYVGEVIDGDHLDHRTLRYNEEGIKDFYFMSLGKGEFVDATKKGNLGRFFNHSCNPNCYVEKWVVGNKSRLGIFAKRKINAGEELGFNYNIDKHGANPKPCYCGESNCAGFIQVKTQT